MKSLPEEIWFLIAGYAHRRDLASIARVSTIHVNASRPILYRDVSLRNSCSVDETISLLLASTVSMRTERLELITDAPLTPQAEWPPLDAIKCMKNLQVVVLREASPFLGSPQQQDFVSTMANFCPHLQDIEVYLESSALGPKFGLQGIRKVRWSSAIEPLSTPFSDPASRCLVLASQATLTHISFPGDIDDFEAEFLISFSTLHFPALQSLVLGAWIDVDSPEIPTAVTRFLVAHPTLSELCLGYCTDDEYRVDLDPTILEAATTPVLPALRHLHAHPSPIRDLAQQAPQSILSLKTLEIGSGHDSNVRFDFTDLFDALRGIGGLPNLKKVRYHAGVSAADDMDLFSVCMDHLSLLCPQVEVWLGDWPQVVLMLHSLLDLLPKFRNLREVALRAWVVPTPEDSSVVDGAKVLASQCPHLKRFIFKPRAGEGVLVIRISRDEDGCMTSANLREEDLSFEEMTA